MPLCWTPVRQWLSPKKNKLFYGRDVEPNKDMVLALRSAKLFGLKQNRSKHEVKWIIRRSIFQENCKHFLKRVKQLAAIPVVYRSYKIEI